MVSCRSIDQSREMSTLRQTPEPGRRLIRYQGDLLRVTLELSEPREGEAGFRTNLHRNRWRLEEIIAHAERDAPILATDWHDLPMRRVEASRFELCTPLLEVGRFEGKAYFLPRGQEEPEWPAGANVVIKVEPAGCAGGNTIYTAFVRQFGPWMEREKESPEQEAFCRRLEAEGYTVIPPSGTFRALLRQLDVIVDRMGFQILLLLPIHPVPTTYARMGRFGSPYAALDFMDVDPALAEHDRRTTPLDQFRELLDAVHRRGARLFMDIPANHTGWASWLQMHHPEWFVRGEDRTFQSPSAWGVTWSDLSQLDYRNRTLWQYMADVFLFWGRQGVDGFRCDAGYKVPLEAWQYIVARVRREYPEVVFLLEGLGGDPSVVRDLLDRANLDWAYSEFFQWYDRHTIERHLPDALKISQTLGTLAHFAETHDNERLASRSPEFARLRTVLAALCADAGVFGITNGVEWFATQKIDVHGAPPLRWGKADNQLEGIARLNALLLAHPCFRPGASIRLIDSGHGNTLAVVRRDVSGALALMVVANLNPRHPGVVRWTSVEGISSEEPLTDLLTGRPARVIRDGIITSCPLGPCEVRCLVPASQAARWPVTVPEALAMLRADHVRRRARIKGFEVIMARAHRVDVTGEEAERVADELLRDPRSLVARVTEGRREERPDASPVLSPTVVWTWPRDTRRVVMLPPRFSLIVTAPHPFRAEIRSAEKVLAQETSLPRAGSGHWALLGPFAPPASAEDCVLDLVVYEPDRTLRGGGTIRLLPAADAVWVKTILSRTDIRESDPCVLLTNGLGGYAQVRAAWGEVRSQYDALLVANLHPTAPGNRRVLFTRCRAWVVYRGYSQSVSLDSLEALRVAPEEAEWTFRVPCGMGRSIRLVLRVRMLWGKNGVRVVFERLPGQTSEHLSDHERVRLILRPDIEDRDPHGKTKAYQGPEHDWPRAVEAHAEGFWFAPAAGRALDVSVLSGRFVAAPEWTYMVAHALDAERGMDPTSDLFSPGYFACELSGGDQVVLSAEVPGERDAAAVSGPFPNVVRSAEPTEKAEDNPLWPVAVRRSLSAFLARRQEGWTVLAGFPWFLDWGRDALVAARGLVAAGWREVVRSILREFARLEQDGTLPNLLDGEDSRNRETSDGPLWFLVACGDLADAEGSFQFAEDRVGLRSIGDVMRSIGLGYLRGCPNGVGPDPHTGLIFSPAHYTWMDTNHPAATPREGYPIEIQALWYRALQVLAAFDSAGRWEDEAGRVSEAVVRYFRRRDGLGLVDCLHAARGQPAHVANADDALRPNQLLAVTLGLVHDPEVSVEIVQACEELVIPGGLRSLADRPVRFPIRIEHGGRLLGDPHAPYRGRYTGDEDTQRKPAYHNGTAWTWWLPAYCEALVRVYGVSAREVAWALLAASAPLMSRGAVGFLPEIADGDAPHTLRGCGAQAWAVTETQRVLAFVESLG